MLGAITGDIVGSVYEGNPIKKKDFHFFREDKYFTDDSVMTVAVAKALLSISDYSEESVKQSVIKHMQEIGKEYFDAGFGGNFRTWIVSSDPKPYGSYGNGSAMRVSSVGWLFDTLEQTRQVARWTAEVTHNHPEGIKGAEATAAVTFLARTGHSKEDILKYVEEEFYEIDKSCDEIRPTYKFDVSCQGTVPQAITAFLEGTSFEDVVRTAVSLGGDSDTLTCIAASMAEAYYIIPSSIEKQTRVYLDDYLLGIVDDFYKHLEKKGVQIANRKHSSPALLIKSSSVEIEESENQIETKTEDEEYCVCKESFLYRLLKLFCTNRNSW